MFCHRKHVSITTKLLFHIKITFSKTDMTNSVTEIPEVRVQLPKWHVILHLYVQHYVQVWGDGCARYNLKQHRV